jgi:hypothetical protein
LEQRPACVVHEKDALQANDGRHEHDVRDGCGLQGNGEVVEVDIKIHPLYSAHLLVQSFSIGIDRIIGVHTIPAKTGIVTKVDRRKINVIIGGGLLGSALKMWFILGCFPYLSTASDATGALASLVMDSWKARLR